MNAGQATPVRGLVYHGRGTMPTVEDLLLDPPQDGEVLVRMVSSGVCHSDLHVVDGEWERPPDVVMGHEGAGIVEALGGGVAGRPAGRPVGAGGLRVGDLVVLAWEAPCGSCPACERGQPWVCGASRGRGHRLEPGAGRLRRLDGTSLGTYLGVGTFCSAQVVAAEAAVPIDPATPPAVAALIGCAATTGIGAVRSTAMVGAGESVVIIGLGGVGMAALMAALDAGADPVVAVDLEAAKRDVATRLGATLAIAPSELPAHVARLPSGGADHAFECIGLRATVELAIDSTRPGGTTILVGMTPVDDRVGLDVYRFVAQGRRLLGSHYGSAVPARDFPAIAADVVSGRIALGELVESTIALDDVFDALEAMRQRQGGRRVVLF